MTTDELIARIKGSDEAARADAWMNAGPLGAPAIQPLAGPMGDSDTETRRAATRACQRIVRHAGRPGAKDEAAAVTRELLAVLKSQTHPGVRREVIWMLSEIAGSEAVMPLAALLSNEELREHARAALERIPGPESVGALKAILPGAPADYKPAIAQSLRARGVEVEGVECIKLKPTKQTEVKPVGR
ncbi:MAG: hypothetical protein AMXMBFR13_01820 [Phycisphaerae bacterium]